MKLKNMTIEQMLKECEKHIHHKCRHCPFCKDIWEIEDDETGAKDFDVDCAISSIKDIDEKDLDEEYDL